jgi:hypothetical protein
VVNRSDGAGDIDPERGTTDLSDSSDLPDRRSRLRRDHLEFNELNISVKVSYKTVLLVFVLFDVFHKVISEAFDSSLLDFLP